PEGVVEARVRQDLQVDYGIEIAAGVGAQYGRVWRVGLLGYNARIENVLALLAALEQVLGAHGHPVTPRSGPQAAQARYARADGAALRVPEKVVLQPPAPRPLIGKHGAAEGERAGLPIQIVDIRPLQPATDVPAPIPDRVCH